MIQARAVRILVLSRNKTLYATRRLLEAASAAGHFATVVDPMDCWVVCGSVGNQNEPSPRLINP